MMWGLRKTLNSQLQNRFYLCKDKPAFLVLDSISISVLGERSAAVYTMLNITNARKVQNY
jgi:hypothetical protein